MTLLNGAYWAAAGLVLYCYVGYPAALWLIYVLRGKPRTGPASAPGESISVILAAHNEAQNLGRRLVELGGQLDRAGGRSELIVVSDGSTDDTAEIVRQYPDSRVVLIDQPQKRGKAASLNAAAAVATGEILVLCDARQVWSADAIERLTAEFANPEIGAVTGDLVLRSPSGVLAGVGLYWRYETAIRRMEAALHSQVGVTGSIAAVRRSLFSHIPEGTILDDVYWPMQVVMKGYRVINQAGAQAYDVLPSSPRGEFRRKVRTLSGNFQLIAKAPAVLLPWKNPVWWQFWSHKVLRLAVPWALLYVLLTGFVIPGTIYRTIVLGEVCVLVLGIMGLMRTPRGAGRLSAASGTFVLLNAAAFLGFWVWLLGRSESAWRKVDYKPAETRPGC